MLAQKMAKCGEAEEPPTAGPSPEGRLEPGGASGQEGTEAQGVADASPDDTFAKQWSTSSRSSYSSQHGGETPGPAQAGWGSPAPLACSLLHRRCVRGPSLPWPGSPGWGAESLGAPGVALGLLRGFWVQEQGGSFGAGVGSRCGGCVWVLTLCRWQGGCLLRAYLSGGCRTSPVTPRTVPKRSFLMPMVWRGSPPAQRFGGRDRALARGGLDVPGGGALVDSSPTAPSLPPQRTCPTATRSLQRR